MQGGKSPRPPSTVESLLQFNGFQHYTNLLVQNGYDNMKFLGDVSEGELAEIGIPRQDRTEVRTLLLSSYCLLYISLFSQLLHLFRKTT